MQTDPPAAPTAPEDAAAPGMRIALVCDYSLEYLGGAQSAFLDQVRIMRERGHAVTVIAPISGAAGAKGAAGATAAKGAAGTGGTAGTDGAAGGVDAWANGTGGAVTVAARVRLAGVDLPVVRNTARLRARLHEELYARGIEVVHLHSEFGLSAAAVAAARELGIPTVQTVHTFFWQASMPRAIGVLAAAAVRGFTRWLRGFAAGHESLALRPLDSALRNVTLSMGRRVDAVISPSAHQAERLRAAGLAHVHTVPNAIALGDAPGEALPADAATGPLRIVWVGRLVPEKRLLEFVDAVVSAAARLGLGALEVEIIGEGPLRAEARQRAEAAPAGTLRFTGRLPRLQVSAAMRGADLVALTSYGFDNQPMTVIEALHAGRSVLYVDPALTEGLEACGILASHTPAGMADAIVRLAEHPDEVVDASARAVVAAREFDPDVYLQRVRTVYAAAAARALP